MKKIFSLIIALVVAGVLLCAPTLAKYVKDILVDNLSLSVDVIGIIPEGGVYYVQEAGSSYSATLGTYSADVVLQAGDPFPATPQTGDVYVYGDYEYRYNVNYAYHGIPRIAGTGTGGWNVRAIDTTKEQYDMFLTEVCDQPVTGLEYIYYACYNMTAVPEGFYIPENTVEVEGAFMSCSLLENFDKALVFPETCTNVQYIFSGCQSLKSIAVSLPNITCESMFSGLSALEYLDLSGSSVTVLGDWFAYYTSIKEIVIPESVKEIGQDAFAMCNELTKITFGSQISSIHEGAYAVSSYTPTTIIGGNDIVSSYDWLADKRLLIDDFMLVVTTPPTTTEYKHGDNFDATGMVVTLYNEDGTSEILEDYEILDGDSLSDGQTSVTISYTREGVTRTATQEITVNPVIPAGGTYYVGVTSTTLGDYSGATAIYTEGDIFPAKPQTGDVYVYGEYVYRYNQYPNTGYNGSYYFQSGVVTDTSIGGWNVNVADMTKESYGMFLDKIGNTPIKSLCKTYMGCINMMQLPDGFYLPIQVSNLRYMLHCCKKLQQLDITTQNGSADTHYMASGCTALKTAIIRSDCMNKLADGTFQNCQNLQSVSLPNCLSSIGSSAFSLCSDLQEISLPDSLITINSFAFANLYKLTQIVLPDRLQTIGVEAFRGCSSLKTITFGSGISRIEANAFYVSTLTPTIINNANAVVNSYDWIGSNRAKIDVFAIAVTTAPNKSIYYHTNNFDRTGMVVTMYLEDGTSTTITDYEILDGTNLDADSQTSITISYTYEGVTRTTTYPITVSHDTSAPTLTVTAPSSQSSSSPTVTYSKSFTVYGSAYDYQTQLKSVTVSGAFGTIPAVLNTDGSWNAQITIDQNAEYVAINVTAEDIEGNTTAITRYVTYIDPVPILTISSPTSANRADVNNTIEVFGTATDVDGQITSVTVNGTQATLSADGAWKANVTLDAKATTMEVIATDDDGKTASIAISFTDFTVTSANRSKIGYTGTTAQNLVIPSFFQDTNGLWYKVINIGASAFQYCSGQLASVSIPNTVTSIGDGAFAYCASLTSIDIPDSVRSLGYYAFGSCSKLTTVTIGAGLNSIGDAAFSCSSLSSVTVDANNASFVSVDGVLFTKIMDAIIRYPCGKTDTAYSVPSGVKTIWPNAFESCRNLTNIILPESLTDIGSAAFESAGITNITIPYGVKTIGRNAFLRCTALTDITVNTNNSSYCSVDGVLYTKDMTSLIAYPIGKRNLSFVIPDAVIVIGESAFQNCGYITSVTITGSVTTIGPAAFQYCFSLTSIVIPSSVTTIENSAFWSCSSLTDVYYTGNETAWGNITIGTSNTYLTDATIHYNQ